MFSPYKFCDIDQNSFLINQNLNLALDLIKFFNKEETQYLWLLNTHRQKTTHALRHTQSIMLRQLKITKILDNTLAYNQVMEVEDTKLVDINPIFSKTIESIERMFLEKGVNQVEWGRIFFSKLLAHSEIDTHIDEGKYFSYYDRFHFVIDSPDNCVFHIRDEDIYLSSGNLYWVNNHAPHWLKNQGDKDRINLIIDARLT
jgi:hypothetical protein